MGWKNFFKPTIAKIVLFLILFLVTSVLNNMSLFFATCCDLGTNYGFPIAFYGYGGGPPLLHGQQTPSYFNISILILDILIWYLVSCGIAGLYHKIRKNKTSLS
ncbi:MAG: hypothetical protein ABIF08_03545 [Nanoarchaeota archaeon]